MGKINLKHHLKSLRKLDQKRLKDYKKSAAQALVLSTSSIEKRLATLDTFSIDTRSRLDTEVADRGGSSKGLVITLSVVTAIAVLSGVVISVIALGHH